MVRLFAFSRTYVAAVSSVGFARRLACSGFGILVISFCALRAMGILGFIRSMIDWDGFAFRTWSIV